MIKNQRPVKNLKAPLINSSSQAIHQTAFNLFPLVRKTCISFLLGSTLLTGCSTLGLSDQDKRVEQSDEVATPAQSKASQHTAAVSTAITQTEPQPSASKANIPAPAAKSPPTLNREKSEPKLAPNFKEPKALQDMRAFSTDMIRGRYTPAETPAKAVASNAINTQPTAKAIYSAPVVTKPEAPKNEPKAAVATVAAAAAVSKPGVGKQVSKTAKSNSAQASQATKAKYQPTTQDVTAAQVNDIIEKSPTAAGVETVALLDKPKEKQAPKVTEAIARVPAEKPAKAKADLVKKALTGKRPAAIGIWSIEENWDGQHPGECRLSTPTIQIDQDGYATQVSFDVINGALFVNTSTNIDISLKDVGIQFGDGAVETFSDNRFANNAIWTGNLSNALNKSDELKLTLGGSELGKRRQQATIDLEDLKQAFEWYQHCNK